MKKKFALIKDGIVKNVIVADADFISKICEQYDKCLELDDLENVQIKDEYNDDLKIFSRPICEEFKCNVEGCTTFSEKVEEAVDDAKGNAITALVKYAAAASAGGGILYAIQNYLS